jgi:hypothetical protein
MWRRRYTRAKTKSAVTMATVRDGKHSFDDRGATAGMRK